MAAPHAVRGLSCTQLVGPPCRPGWGPCSSSSGRSRSGVGAAPASVRSRQRQQPCRPQAAKKGGGGGGGGKKGGGGQKKGPGLLTGILKQPYTKTDVVMQNLLMVESHYRKTKRPMFTQELEIQEVAKALWEAPFAVLAHDTSEPEPLFVYGNAKALELFECSWEELVGTLSTQSAEEETEVQEERSAALAAALKRGYIDNYEGWRKSFKGTRFRIGGATLFNVEAPSGTRVGQAAVIREWEYEDGTKGGEGAVPEAAPEEAADEAPAAPAADAVFEDYANAEAAVADQAALVRSLKEDQGLGNGSGEVQAAVQELLQRKARLTALQR